MADEEVAKEEVEEETAAAEAVEGAGEEEETPASTVPAIRYLSIQLKCVCIWNDKICQHFCLLRQELFTSPCAATSPQSSISQFANFGSTRDST